MGQLFSAPTLIHMPGREGKYCRRDCVPMGCGVIPRGSGTWPAAGQALSSITPEQSAAPLCPAPEPFLSFLPAGPQSLPSGFLGDVLHSFPEPPLRLQLFSVYRGSLCALYGGGPRPRWGKGRDRTRWQVGLSTLLLPGSPPWLKRQANEVALSGNPRDCILGPLKTFTGGTYPKPTGTVLQLGSAAHPHGTPHGVLWPQACSRR